VPSSLAASVLGVTGLDNAAPVQPHVTRTAQAARPGAAAPKNACSGYWGQHTATVTYKQNGTDTYPTMPCGYTAGQLRSAYGMNSASTGKGQTVALIEDGLTQDMFTALTKYAAGSKGLPAPSAARYREISLGGTFVACGDPFHLEEALDVEAAYGMAPGANELVVGADACDNGDGGMQGLFNAWATVLNGNGKQPLATVVSNSWGSGSEDQPVLFTDVEHSYLVRAAAEGVGMYVSAGDLAGVTAPSNDPYAIAVGGTSLGIGKTGSRVFETGWSTNIAFYYTAVNAWQQGGASLGVTSGGPSLLWSQPSYQRGIVPKPLASMPAGDLRWGLVRSVPDISADADAITGMEVLDPTVDPNGVTTGYISVQVGGTSLAAPLVAAAQQGQEKPFGFIDPALYKVGKTSAIHDVLPVSAASCTANTPTPPAAPPIRTVSPGRRPIAARAAAVRPATGSVLATSSVMPSGV
jgi:subtilase family serine protease